MLEVGTDRMMINELPELMAGKVGLRMPGSKGKHTRSKKRDK